MNGIYPADKTTINNAPTNRENLEWLVYHALQGNDPCISMSRGAELLGFGAIRMRQWMFEYKLIYNRVNKVALEEEK